MIKLAELNYHCHTEYSKPEEVIAKHELSSGFIHFIKHRVDLLLVKHLNYEGGASIENIRYAFFKSRNRFWYIPFKTHRFLKKEMPDIILVQGFVFPLQVMFLRWKMGNRCRIIVQHHGEKPFNGIKGFLQRKTDACIDRYLFTSVDNAGPWLSKKIISSREKCFEVLSASTGFVLRDKKACKRKLNISGNDNFLWVARLNNNKDPLSVLVAFERYLAVNFQAALYMIYQTDELLPMIEHMRNVSPHLNNAVHLIGRIDHEQLPDWYSAVEFYISGSHSEGSGYALAEAMACGCIPVVTAIPSFIKIAGEYGTFFKPGDLEELYEKLVSTGSLDKEKCAQEIRLYAQENLSYKVVADQVYRLCSSLVSK
jgi:glycosyltransferase involved in cell wall biosynthesis